MCVCVWVGEREREREREREKENVKHKVGKVQQKQKPLGMHVCACTMRNTKITTKVGIMSVCVVSVSVG